MTKKEIHIKGARVNNLKNIDLKIPRDKLIVITGVSGSGKSSLAFDTLFAEGQRRFAESLSSFARQFLGRMNKPAVDYITGIPPAIAIGQRVQSRNSRSTVASSSEIYDYLKLLYAKIGRTYSPISGKEVTCDTPKSVSDYVFSLAQDSTALIMADMVWKEDGKVEKLLDLKQEGFVRVVSSEGTIFRIEEVLQNMEEFEQSDIYLLVDRIIVIDNEDTRSRLLDSIQTAFVQGKGRIAIFSNGLLKEFSNIFERDGIVFERPAEHMFSYNNPIGACPECGGFGKVMGIDEALVIPDPTLSVYEGAVACWKGETMSRFFNDFIMESAKTGFPIHKPYNKLSPQEKLLLWEGDKGSTAITPFFKWIESKKYKIQFNYMLSRYSGKTTCRLCAGTRLKEQARWVKIGGKDITELMQMQIGDLAKYFDALQPGSQSEIELDEYDYSIASRALKEIAQRLDYLKSVGLSYLTLDRPSSTLSGGESQRIALVSSLGNNLVGSMYILDEPSIGLHPRDTRRLISVLKKLRDLGNTVIVVEHDEDIIRAADQLIDIGPLAGKLGGEVVYQGPINDSDTSSITLRHLSERVLMKIPPTGRIWNHYIEVVGAMQNNLKNINVRFPLKCLTAVTGVSGSGKSSLVGDILYPALYRHIHQLGSKPGLFRGLRGDLGRINAVEYVDQNPIGKSTRSNPVTYLKVYDDIRKLFSEQPYAKINNYGHSHFSFNIDGGRCPECQGEGVIKIEMQFMADVAITCEACGGKRFQPDILEVRFQGKNISDILSMSVDEAIEFFSAQEDPTAKRIADKLQPLSDVGLSYVSLGQSSSTLSGGESQRIKLASFLGKESSSGSIMFIFDEPTTGLHFQDIEKLLQSFDALIEKGHSVVVVEHNLDIIRRADWIIDLGPDAGDKGGELVFEGTPEMLALHPELPTGAALAGEYRN
jgi:excinuclease ABC subunit A